VLPGGVGSIGSAFAEETKNDWLMPALAFAIGLGCRENHVLFRTIEISRFFVAPAGIQRTNQGQT
jgi:hypothetical protein